MEDSTANNAIPEYPSFGPTCETCKKPDMSNTSGEDGIKHLFSTYFAAPRMWPVGYILASPYSPLRLEREMPSRNWRDAFEDLLALESGGEMIRAENRKVEDQVAARERYRRSSWIISNANRCLEKTNEEETLLHELYSEVAKRKDNFAMDTIRSELLPPLEPQRQMFIARAQEAKANYEKERDCTASRWKLRGQWIASLMNSGALPTWTTALESYGTVSLSEQGLSGIFENDKPWKFATHPPLPQGPIDALVGGSYEWGKSQGIPEEVNFNPKKAMVAQCAETEPTKLPDGSMGSKTLLRNTLADGTLVDKTFVEQPGELYEEILKAQQEMDDMRGTVAFLIPKPLSKSRTALFKLMARDEAVALGTPDD
ncbi:MAG: hypothetical protein Q9208_001418 [Pyrenodesmia sp. 3 TL-2023]